MFKVVRLSFSDFFYYTLLKHGKIIIALVGLTIAVIVFFHAQKFGLEFKKTTSSSIKYCESDSDCFEHCGECVSIATPETCEPNESINCICVNNTCVKGPVV